MSVPHELVSSMSKMKAVDDLDYLADLKNIAHMLVQRGYLDVFNEMKTVIEKARKSLHDSDENKIDKPGPSIDVRCGACSGCYRYQKCGICDGCVELKNCLKCFCNGNVVPSSKSTTEEAVKSLIAVNENETNDHDTSIVEQCNTCPECIRSENCGLCVKCAEQNNCKNKKPHSQPFSNSTSEDCSTRKNPKLKEYEVAPMDNDNSMDDDSEFEIDENEVSSDEQGSVSEFDKFDEDVVTSESEFSEDDNESDDFECQTPGPSTSSDASKIHDTRSQRQDSFAYVEPIRKSRKRKSTDSYDETNDHSSEAVNHVAQISEIPKRASKRTKIRRINHDNYVLNATASQLNHQRLSYFDEDDNIVLQELQESAFSNENPLTENGQKEKDDVLTPRSYGNADNNDESSTTQFKRYSIEEIQKLPIIEVKEDINNRIIFKDGMFSRRNTTKSMKIYECMDCKAVKNRYNRAKTPCPKFSTKLFFVIKNGKMHCDEENFLHICHRSNKQINENGNNVYGDSVLHTQTTTAVQNCQKDIESPSSSVGNTIECDVTTPTRPNLTFKEIQSLPIIEVQHVERDRFLYNGHVFSMKRKYKLYTAFQCMDCRAITGRASRAKTPVVIQPSYLYEIDGEIHCPEDVIHICEDVTMRNSERMKAQLPIIHADFDENGNFLLHEHLFVPTHTKNTEFTSYCCRLCKTISSKNPFKEIQCSYLYVKPDGTIYGDYEKYSHICNGPKDYVYKGVKKTKLQKILQMQKMEPECFEIINENGNNNVCINNTIFKKVKSRADKVTRLRCSACRLIQINSNLEKPGVLYFHDGNLYGDHAMPSGKKHFCDYELDHSQKEYDRSLFHPDNDTELSVEEFLEELQNGTLYTELKQYLEELEQQYPHSPRQNYNAYVAFTRSTGTVKELIKSIVWYGRAEDVEVRADTHLKNGPLSNVFATEKELHFAPLLMEQQNWDKSRNTEALLLTFTAMGKLFFKFNTLKNSRIERIGDEDLFMWTFNKNNGFVDEHDRTVKAMKQMVHAAMRMRKNFISFKRE